MNAENIELTSEEREEALRKIAEEEGPFFAEGKKYNFRVPKWGED